MTIAGHSPLHRPLSPPVGERWTLRWSGNVTRWSDPFDACPAGTRQGRVELVVALELIERDRLEVEAWLELPGRREPVMAVSNAACHSTFDGRLLHLDATLAGGQAIAVSLDLPRRRLLYARTTLLQAAGFKAGALDPPGLAGCGGRHEG